jgi:uncharacterized protein (TIGR03437 family)
MRTIACLFLVSILAEAQVCRLSVAGLNRARRVTGVIRAECPTAIHTPPFGNWGASSNFGQKGNSHQFDGWCHNQQVCDNGGSCKIDCTDGWYEWNSCTDHSLYSAPNCSLYNAAGCTEQQSTTGINVHGTKIVDIPVRCPINTNGAGSPDQGGCNDVQQYSTGTNFLSLYELDPVCCDELVQTVYFPDVSLALKCDALGCASNSSEWMQPVSWDSPATPAKVFAEVAALVNWGAFVDNRGACRLSAPMFSVVSAASFAGPNVAQDSIAAAFGEQLSPVKAEATFTPLPTSLVGVVVTITDSKGVERPAPLFYISSSQVNFQIPVDIASGQAKVSIFNGPVLRSTARVQVEHVAPAVFTKGATGKGIAAAVAIRVATDGSTVVMPADAIDMGSAGDTVYLSLFGTGIRNRSTLTDVAATIGGLNATVTYAGPQGEFVGLDQVNLVLPRELNGRGTVDIALTVETRAANVTQIVLQ